MDEQLFWARQLEQLGLAGKPLPAKRVTSKALAKELTRVLENRTYKQNAKLVSQAMLKQSGVDTAVCLIEKEYQNNFR